MIRHAGKDPSGFWTGDCGGCGNPAIFPEFEEGLKRGELVRFKTRMENGDYDCVEHFSPLLTKNESKHIEDSILAKRCERERCEGQKRQERLRKAATLIAKYSDLATDCATRRAFNKSKPTNSPAMMRRFCRKLTVLSVRLVFSASNVIAITA